MGAVGCPNKGGICAESDRSVHKSLYINEYLVKVKSPLPSYSQVSVPWWVATYFALAVYSRPLASC